MSRTYTLKIKLRFSDGYDNDGLLYVPFRSIQKCIDNTPTADVEEVKHGVWKDIFEERIYALSLKYKHIRVCSVCEGQSNRYYEYCPYCGAKMDGGKDGN